MALENRWLKRFIDRWLWLCPLLGILVAASVLVVFGLSFWMGLFAALLLVCPAIMVWGFFKLGGGYKAGMGEASLNKRLAVLDQTVAALRPPAGTQ